MVDLNPRSNTKDWIEPIEKIVALRSLDQCTRVDNDLTQEQHDLLTKVLERNKDLLAWTSLYMFGMHLSVMSHKL